MAIMSTATCYGLNPMWYAILSKDNETTSLISFHQTFEFVIRFPNQNKNISWCKCRIWTHRYVLYQAYYDGFISPKRISFEIAALSNCQRKNLRQKTNINVHWRHIFARLKLYGKPLLEYCDKINIEQWS